MEFKHAIHEIQGEFRVGTKRRKLSGGLLFVLTPFTLLLDVVTLPVQIIVMGSR